jgi:lysophospholipase L1-like esterase
MHRSRFAFATIISLLFALAARGDEAKKYDPARWERDIARFVDEDARVRRVPGATVFVGSSSIRLWDLDKSFPEHHTINRGFGGSQLEDSVYFVDRLVLRHSPPVIVLYAGDNDIASGKSPEQVAADYAAFVAAVHEKLPQSKIVYIGIKPSVKRWHLIEKIRTANKLIQTAVEKDERLVFVDVDAPMLGEDGKPRKELLREDGLHLTPAGYEVWTKLVTPHLPAPK